MSWDRRVASAALGALFYLGCSTYGTGRGELTRRNGPSQAVVFSWHSTGADATQGDLSAALTDGQSFTGDYFQITSTTQSTTLEPLWAGYTPWWPDWEWREYGAFGPERLTHYSGKVLATLTNIGGQRMRCRFQLADPPAGMAGGGQGRCQLRGGAVVEASFPRR